MLADVLDKVKAHICDSGASIHSPLMLHLNDSMLDQLLFVLIEFKLLHYQPVSLNRFCSGKLQRQPRLLCMILYNGLYGVDSPVNSAAVVVLAAKILLFRLFLIFRYMQRVFYQLVYALVFSRGDRYNRNAKHSLHAVDIDRAVVSRDLVHHI